jgi:hypothetical protein
MPAPQKRKMKVKKIIKYGVICYGSGIVYAGKFDFTRCDVRVHLQGCTFHRFEHKDRQC